MRKGAGRRLSPASGGRGGMALRRGLLLHIAPSYGEKDHHRRNDYEHQDLAWTE
jgi:hypothetical protein